MRALVVALVFAGCGRGDPAPAVGRAGSGSGAAPDLFGRRAAAERACAAAVVALTEVALDPAAFRMPDQDRVERAACAELYGGACRDAWLALGRHRADIPAVIGDCARTYCETLPAPRPDGCRSDPAPRDAAMLEQLDAAILEHEGTARPVAGALAIRARVFAPIVTIVPPVVVGGVTPTHSTMTIDLDPTELRIGGAPVSATGLAGRIADAIAADPDTTFVLACDGAVGYGRVIEVMDAIKAAGGVHIALTTK